MALAIDASSPALATIPNTGASVTSASFTPPAGSQLWVGTVFNGNAGGQTTTVASTPSLGAFSQIIMTNTQEVPSSWHYASIVTSQSYTVTATRSNTNNRGMSMLVRVITGMETTPGGQTATANNNSGLPSQTITTTRDGSLILAVSGDWAQAGLGTAGTSQTILAEHNLSGDYTSHFWRRDGFPVATSYTINLTAPSAQDYNLSIVEIRAAAIPAAPLPRRYGIPAAILNR